MVDVRNKAFGFFEACESAVDEVEKRANEVEVALAWRTRVEMLSVVEGERLFVSGMEGAEVLLKRLVEMAVRVIFVSHERGTRSSVCLLGVFAHIILYSTRRRAPYKGHRSSVCHLANRP